MTSCLGTPGSPALQGRRVRDPWQTEPTRIVLLAATLALFGPPAVAGGPVSAGTDLIHWPAEAADVAMAPGSVASDSVAARAAKVWRVEVDEAAVAASPETLWLELAPGRRRAARRVAMEGPVGGDLVWRGRFIDDMPAFADDYAGITLSLHGGALLGTLTTPEGDAYDLRPSPSGGYRLRALADAGFHCGVGGGGDLAAAEAEPPAGSPGMEAVTPSAAAAARDVYVLVLFTPSAALRSGGARQLVNAAAHNVAVMNTALRNSRVEGRVRLAAALEADLGFDGQEEMDAVRHAIEHPLARQLQDRWRADVVSVVADGSREILNTCGWANVLYRGNRSSMRDRAYHVIRDGCFDGYIFTHEVGHNFGAQHDPARAYLPSQAIYPYSFAHGVDGAFRTVMSYPTACTGCFVLRDHFSNPLVRVDGIATGIAGERDNALTLEQTFPFVATFRAGRPPAFVPDPPPAAPAGLAAEALSEDAVALAWEDRSSDETGFQADVRPDAAGDWQRVASLSANTVGHTVDGLEAATAYRFRVRAVRGDSASAFSEVAVATTLLAPPAVPAGLRLDDVEAFSALVSWQPAAGADHYQVELRFADPAADEVRSQATTVLALEDLPEATPFSVRVRAVNARAASAWSAPRAATTAAASLPPSAPCTADAEALCLLAGRFEARAWWRNPRQPGHGGAAAVPAPASGRTGAFSFFDPANVELVVKMLDGTAVNGHYWLFYGALTDVEYWISLRDSETGERRTYYNPPLEMCGRSDTAAFAGPADAPVAAMSTAAPVAASVGETAITAGGACAPGPEALCLAGGRFRVEVAWENQRVAGEGGAGRVFDGLGSDLSGHFWFFRPDNLELAVKILDGRAINGHHWLFWGGLSDVGYTLRVTDTESGTLRDFESPPGRQCSRIVSDQL